MKQNITRRRRKKAKLFAGAYGKAKDSIVMEHYIVQPKHDGQYVEIDLECNGKICEVRSKTGRVLQTEEARSMLGVFAGYPNSTLCGELMGHTEAGKKDARDRGYARIILFDALVLEDRLVQDDPYRLRLEQLNQMHAELGELVGNDKPWWDDERARARDFHGRFTRRVPKSWKRTPIVKSYYGDVAKTLWEEYVMRDGGEGVVFCDPDAYVGKRSAKLKRKPMSSVDCEVVALSPRHAKVEYFDISAMEHGDVVSICLKKSFIVSHSLKWELELGDMIEVGYEGLHEASGDPKFPRILRKRVDLL